MSAALIGGLPSRTTLLGEEWLEGLSGKHRQFLDVGALDAGAPLKRASNLLDAYAGAPYLLRDADVNIVFGAHGTAVPMVVSDETWETLTLDEYAGLTPGTPRGSGNPFLKEAADHSHPGVQRLQSRGVRFIACRQSIARLSRQIAERSKKDASAVEHTLISGLAPGVVAVPAMIVAANRAQESGLTYEWIS